MSINHCVAIHKRKLWNFSYPCIESLYYLMLLFPSWPQPQVTCLLSLCMSALMCLSQLEPQCLPFRDWFTSLSLCPGSSMCQSPPFEGQVLWTFVLLFLVIQLHPPFCCCKRCRCEHGCPDPCPNPIFIWLGFAVLFIWVLIYSAGFGVYPRASCIWGKPSSAELHHKCLVLSFGHAPTNGLAILALIFLLAVSGCCKWALSCLDDASKSIQCCTLTLQPEAWPRRVTHPPRDDVARVISCPQIARVSAGLEWILALQSQQPYPPF